MPRLIHVSIIAGALLCTACGALDDRKHFGSPDVEFNLFSIPIHDQPPPCHDQIGGGLPARLDDCRGRLRTIRDERNQPPASEAMQAL